MHFITDLSNAGFSRVHIIAHSMGARILNTAAPGLQDVCGDGPDQLNIQTVTMLNPDCELNEFTKAGGAYDDLRAIAPTAVFTVRSGPT